MNILFTEMFINNDARSQKNVQVVIIKLAVRVQILIMAVVYTSH